MKYFIKKTTEQKVRGGKIFLVTTDNGADPILGEYETASEAANVVVNAGDFEEKIEISVDVLYDLLRE